MNIIQQKINGHHQQQNQQHSFIIDPHAPTTFYLRYALVLMGTDAPIFPESLLDDWGNEITKLRLYRWFNEFAPQFPRAEIFGLDAHGRPTQHFLRDFEQYVKHPTYLAPSPTTPIDAAPLLSHIIISDPTCATPTRLTSPPDYKRPLRAAAVTWHRAPPPQPDLRGFHE